MLLADHAGWRDTQERSCFRKFWGLFYIYFPFFGHTSQFIGSQFLSYVHAQSFQSCLTLCDPLDHSPPGSSVNGILQARLLEWVAMLSPMEDSGDLPDPGIEPLSLVSPALQMDSLPLHLPGSPELP